jgi:hypothetical protein
MGLLPDPYVFVIHEFLPIYIIKYVCVCYSTKNLFLYSLFNDALE